MRPLQVLISLSQFLDVLEMAFFKGSLHVLDNHRMQLANSLGGAQQDFAHFSSDGHRNVLVLGNCLDLATIKVTVIKNILVSKAWSPPVIRQNEIIRSVDCDSVGFVLSALKLF